MTATAVRPATAPAAADTELSRAATDQILRRLGVVIGVGAVIVMTLELPAVLIQPVNRSIWPEVHLIAAYALFLPLAMVSARGPVAAIRRVAGAAAICYFAATVTTPLVYSVVSIGSFASWPYRGLVLGVMAGGLAWSGRLAAGFAAVLAVATSASNAAVVPDSSAWALFGDITRALGVAALFLWCVVYARTAAERVDREAVRQRSRAATVAATAAREREGARFAALIHDAVLSTLLEASRAGESSAVLRSQAARTLDQLDQARSAPELDHLDAAAAVEFLRAAVREVDPDVHVQDFRRGADLCLPLEAAQVLGAALSEAVRNSLRHADVAGRRVRREVSITVATGGIRVALTDDGAGFDPARVPADRMGIAGSILGRMRTLAGGAAFVESAPGAGTVVTLVWGSDG
ncbi:sensor histidine kinase [Nocardia asteroides]|uniref:Two-component histidine kinase n=1 Tax=Nocardia asteroides NBRC 15531 TaxID=1110697 RepID=U5EA84_NOCAS|nr:ATP-binding protein [Nocardia asteroides]TLF64552.1 ATP-binding protein [Nocardia asteroides NBRC 15531]UGT50336.1 ATP-binding protein [Nocardia asteroides]SFN11939.1 Signal transduction histidine kinase [Nocardia asteroides]VEG36876.1 Signal transduction histidine kinase [Nocardia asteroides]GAD82069.1 putative two-component histidine kinase [Nocardia asteroides NBRC 15531]